MNRIIKFRAWNKQDKYMIEWDDDEMKNAELLDLENTNFEWMQYTGLKDRNGKEIYEMDILRYIDDGLPPSDGKRTRLMGWEEGSLEPFDPFNYWEDIEDWVVIGNEFEGLSTVADKQK